MRKILLAAVLVLSFAAQASAEWGMYVSRNGKPWRMEQTYAFETTGGVKGGGCKYAAADLWRTEGPGRGTVTGITCQEYDTTVYANRGPAPTPRGLAPVQAGQPSDGGRGRADANVEYYQRLYEAAQENARSGGQQRVYSNGESYGGRNVREAAESLGRAQQQTGR